MDEKTKKDFKELLDKAFENNFIRLFNQGYEELIAPRFEEIDQRFERVDKRFEQVDKKFEQVEQRLDRLETKLDKVAEKVTDHDLRLTRVEKSRVIV